MNLITVLVIISVGVPIIGIVYGVSKWLKKKYMIVLGEKGKGESKYVAHKNLK